MPIPLPIPMKDVCMVCYEARTFLRKAYGYTPTGYQAMYDLDRMISEAEGIIEEHPDHGSEDD